MINTRWGTNNKQKKKCNSTLQTSNSFKSMLS